MKTRTHQEFCESRNNEPKRETKKACLSKQLKEHEQAEDEYYNG